MYYKEEVINGVLCHKGTPDGDWVPFTPEALTIKLKGANDRIKAMQEFIDSIRPDNDPDDLKKIFPLIETY